MGIVGEEINVHQQCQFVSNNDEKMFFIGVGEWGKWISIWN